MIPLVSKTLLLILDCFCISDSDLYYSLMNLKGKKKVSQSLR